MCGWTYRAIAANYTVTALVPAPALTEGAVVTHPNDGDTFTNGSITVTGTCPSDSYVTLSRNNVFSGVAWCMSAHAFTITTDLFSGENVLQAQDYNVTDSPGPTTPAVTVTYKPIVKPTGSPSTPTGTSVAATPLSVNEATTSAVADRCVYLPDVPGGATLQLGLNAQRRRRPL